MAEIQPISPVNAIQAESPRETARRLNVFALAHGRRLCHIAVTVRGSPVSFGTLAARVVSSGLDILDGFTTVDNTQRTALCSFFAEVRENNFDLNRLKTDIGSFPFVISCQVRESKDGFMLDTVNFPIRSTTGERILLVKQDAFSDSLDRIRSMTGGAADILVFEMGFAAGQRDASAILHEFGRERIFDQSIDLSLAYRSLGWGKAHLVKINPDGPRLEIVVEECFECEGRVSNRSVCYFMGGHLAGGAYEIFRTMLRCEETKCSGLGDHHCEFVLGPLDVSQEGGGRWSEART
jgi:predicted hydrocarbon binding protein